MIMAGRGRRLEDTSEGSSKVGSPPTSSEKAVDLPSMINKITEIDTNNVNLTLLSNIESMFKLLVTSEETIKDVVSDLHVRALDDAEFGEKLILALEQISHLKDVGALVRGELLSFIQNDFKAKDTQSQTNKKTFLNSVLLLGNVYQKFKICGAPIAVLGIALLEYFNLLIKGEEEELKVLVKQIFINGTKLSEVKGYEEFMQNLRTTLVTTNQNSSSKYWILLAIDFMANNLKPLNGALRDFYIKNLGEEYTKMESVIHVENKAEVQSPISPSSIKNQDSSSSGNKNFNFSSNKADGFRKDLSKKFSDMNMKSGGMNKDKIQSLHGKNNKKDNWKSSGGNRGSSGHDDRFDKDENYYGAQKPRQPKPLNVKNKFVNFKITKQVDEDFKTDTNKLESQQEAAEDKFQD